MKFTELTLKDAYTIEPKSIKDERGAFARIFCKNEFSKIGSSNDIFQINHSLTRKKGTVRGMHFQYSPKAEIKMVKCIRGLVWDVIVDLRKGSKTFLKWQGVTLSAENGLMIYIPKGFAHGFQTVEPNCELLYFHTECYSPEFEGAVRHDDPMVGIQWQLDVTEISERDMSFPLLPNDYEGIEI